MSMRLTSILHYSLSFYKKKLKNDRAIVITSVRFYKV